MKKRRHTGFTLPEFVIAIVFVGIVMGPFLVFVARIHDLNGAVGQQGRREAWRSFNDQAVAAGIDPGSAPALVATTNAAIPAATPLVVSPLSVAPVPGLARIVPLRVQLDATVAENRMAGAGYQLGAGEEVAPRSTPAAPLVPIVMPMPVMTPAAGSVIAVGALTPAGPGEPCTTNVQAASTTGTQVVMAFNQPFGTAVGAGLAQRSVTAVDLLNLVNGIAWTEYPGDPARGDEAVVLGDGRKRWLTTRADGRRQIYEPSPSTGFAYQIGLGSPVLVQGAVEHAAGETLAFDYAAYFAVQTGATTLKIDFAVAVKDAFGTGWPTQAIGFQCAFGDEAAPFSGDLRPFFQPDSLSAWSDELTVTATPVAPAGATTGAASWIFERIESALGAPVLSNAADAAGFFVPGQMQFSAPPGPDGTPVGRLSFENGTHLSTGPTLSVSVTP